MVASAGRRSVGLEFIALDCAPSVGRSERAQGHNLLGVLVMKVRGSIFVVALLTAAVAISACRREMPHPKGLGAGDLVPQAARTVQ